MAKLLLALQSLLRQDVGLAVGLLRPWNIMPVPHDSDTFQNLPLMQHCLVAEFMARLYSRR